MKQRVTSNFVGWDFRFASASNNQRLFSFHKVSNFVMAADKKEYDLVAEFKKDAVFKTRPDFPVVLMPVFQAKARRQCGFTIKVFHESIYGSINLLPAGKGKLLEATVKAGFKFVYHFIPSCVSSACVSLSNPCMWFQVPFSID